MKFLFALLILATQAYAQTFTVIQTTWNPAPESVEAKQWGIVPRNEFPPEVKDGYWTANSTRVWAVPPTTQQVQTAAQISTVGGPNPYGAASGQVPTFPKNTFVMLDAENREDATGNNNAAVLDMVMRYREAGGSRTHFTVFAMRYTLSNGAWPWWAENQFGWTRSFEAERVQLKPITDQMPILLLDLYPNEEKIDQQLAALDFFVTNLRRLYSNKKLYVITRGDSFPPGSNGAYTHIMDPELMERMAAYIRSRFDGAIVWGIRGAGNVKFAKTILRPRGWDAEIK